MTARVPLVSTSALSRQRRVRVARLAHPVNVAARLAALGMCLLLLVVIAAFHTVSFDYDARQYYSLAASLLEDHDLDTRNQGLMLAPAQFPPGFSVLAAPLAAWMSHLRTRRVVPLEVDDLSEMIPEARVPLWHVLGLTYRVPTWKGGHTYVYGSMMTALALVSLAFLGLAVWVCSESLCRRAYWIPLLMILGSPMCLYNATSYLLYATLTAVGLSSCALALYRSTSRPVATALACGLACGTLVTIRYEAALMLVAYIVGCIRQGDRRRAIALAVGAAPLVALLMYYNALYFGAPLASSYDTERLNVFTVSMQRLYWYVFDLRSGLLVFSSLAVLSLAGLANERDRTLVWIPICLACLYLLRVNVRTDAHTAGLDINRYMLLLFPYFALGLRNHVDRLGAKAVAIASCVATLGFAQFFTLFPFRDQHHYGMTPFAQRILRETPFAPQTIATVVGSPPKPVLFAASAERALGTFDLRHAALFHKYSGYYGFVVSAQDTVLRGTLFDTGPHLLVTQLRPCRGDEAKWGRARFASISLPF